MKKFIKYIESVKKEKHFDVDVKITLTTVCETEGEAGYITDSIIKNATIENMTHYEVMDIRLNENISEKADNKETAQEFISNKWSENKDSIYEFYHKMRLEGYDGKIILEIIQPKN
jgi:ferritin-like protein